MYFKGSDSVRFFMTFSYDGSKYNGYQRQPKTRTIQGELEKALKTINANKSVSVVASGRTDAGVHAYNQCAHFDIDITIAPSKLKQALNSLIPNDMYIKNVYEAKDSFHARFDVKAKEYIYKINMGNYNPIEKDYVFQYNKKLDIPELERALKYLEGTHDFRSFVKIDEEKDNYVRTIVQTSLIRDIKNVILANSPTKVDIIILIFLVFIFNKYFNVFSNIKSIKKLIIIISSIYIFIT